MAWNAYCYGRLAIGARFSMNKDVRLIEQAWRDKVSEIKAQLPIGVNPQITE